jgi:adenylate cyclase
LWGEQAEVPLGELFDVQDRIVRRIVAGIAPSVRAAEMRAAMRKRPESFTAYDYTLRGLHVINSLDVSNFPLARDFLNKAMAEDPNFAMPVAWAARWHSLNVGQGWSTDPAEDSKKAVELAAKAIELDSQNALAIATYAHLKSYLFHDYDSALVYFDRALAVCPNHSLAWLLSAGTLSYVGQTKKAIEHAQRGLRLSPFDRGLYYYYMFLMLAHYADGAYEDAIRWGRLAISENPTYTATHRFLAASLVAADKVTEATEVTAAMMRLEPRFRLSVYYQTRQPFREPGLRDRLMEHLRKAGFPE